jgi:transitional endoplasmic reticulum ATPase
VVNVVRHGEEFIIPHGMDFDRAIAVLQRRKLEDEQEVSVWYEFDTFPWDGARALMKALKNKFGWADYSSHTVETFFGPIKNNVRFMQIEVGPKQYEPIAWGQVMIPGVDGTVNCSTSVVQDGTVQRLIFALGGQVKRKHENVVAELAAEIRKVLATDSIYKGKAIRIRFRDEKGQQFIDPWSGQPLPLQPHFLHIDGITEKDMVFSRRVEGAIRTNIFTPIERTAAVKKAGIPLKRGVLLAGQFGVGKTLVAHVTAKKATENGWSFLYVETASELPDAIKFAQMYAPAVVFCEDIDRFVGVEKRDVKTDELLNIIDGIDTKTSEVMVVLTTNEVEKIHQSMLRPGRLDAVINVEPPDAEAAQRLIHLYGRGLVPLDEDLSMVGDLLAGSIPAVIRETVERAKLSAIGLNEGGALVVTGSAMLDATQTMQMQLELLKPKVADERSDMEKAADRLGGHLIEMVKTPQRQLPQ